MRVHALPLPLPKSARAPPARPWGWVPRVLAAIVALAIGFIALAALELNRPWVKRQVQALARSSSGFDVDYGSIHFRLLSGVEVDDLVVHAAPEFRAFGPDLLRASRVDVRWSRSSLLGHGPRVRQIALTDVALTVVVDEHGRTSFDAIGLAGARFLPSGPLSRWPGQLLASAPLAARLDVTRADLAVIWTQGGRVVERDRVRGFGAGVAAEPGPGGWRVHAAMGSAAAPLDLDVMRDHDGAAPGGARARFSLAADLTASVLTFAGDLKALDQSFFPSVSSVEPGDWHAEGSVRFDPAAGRTTLALDRVKVGAGAATAEALLEVPDEGDVIVRHAQGDVDAAHLLAWAPAGFVPFAAQVARLHYRIDSATLERRPRLMEGGGFHVEGELSNAKLRTTAGLIDVDGGRLEVDGRAAPASGMTLWGSQQIDGARIESPRESLDVRDLAVDFDGQRAGDGALTGRLDLRFGRLGHQGARATVVARDGHCELRFERLYASRVKPLGTRGDVAVSAYLTSLDASLATSRVVASSVLVDVHGNLEGHAPYGGTIDASASSLQVFGGGGRLVARTPARLGVHLQDVFLDPVRPLASRGVVRASLDFDRGQASLDAVKGPDSVAYTLRAAASSLDALRPLLSPGRADAARWNTIAIRSTGRVERLLGGDPLFEEDTSLDVERPAFEGVSARSRSLDLHSRGTALRHEVAAKGSLLALAIPGAAPSDDTVALSATVDRGARSVHMEADVEGRVKAKFAVSASLDRDAGAVSYDVDGRLSGLAPIAPLVARVRGLDGFDLSQLELGFAARGALLGVVSSVGRDGAIGLEPDPLRTAAIEGTADVRVTKLRWGRGDVSLEVPAAAWHGDMRADGTRRTLDGHADMDSLRLGLGHHQIDLEGISDDATVTVTGDLQDPTIDLTQRAAIRAVQQDFVVEYPVGDVTLALSARRDAEGLVRVSGMSLHNGNGGTTLALAGGIDLAGRHRRLSMSGELWQDLEPLSVLPDVFAGGGQAELAATVESSDLAVFRTRLDLKLAAVHVRLPGVGVEADSVDGEIPISVVFDAGHGGIAIRRDVRPSPYARLRFADRHPLIRRSGFLSIGHLTTPHFTIAPFIGNLAVEQNVVSLRQFELGVRSGWLTGESALVWDGSDSTLEVSLRANGVRSSHDEPFDGNIAVVVAARDRMIAGRADVRRMGRRHLLDLFDAEDPLHVDAAMNGVRSALVWGYPKRLRVVFDNGFADAHIELGGLAKFWRLDDLRGIPTGPIVDRLVAAVLEGKAAP